MKIKFLPFLNDNDGKLWREKLENEFMSQQEVKDITKEINELRNSKPDILKTYDEKYKNSAPAERKKVLREKESVSTPEVVDYYKRLRSLKEERQQNWIKYLMNRVAEVFEQKLIKLKDDEKEKSKTTIVAALPEFFWCDINDNAKHSDRSDIINYQKPIYINNIASIFCAENEISKLTKDYPNLIFFAGTVKWKVPVNEDRSQEDTYNTLFIYNSGDLPVMWGKHHFSAIDGFSSVNFRYTGLNVKRQVFDIKSGGEIKGGHPKITFNGIDFVYDICLDFISNKDGFAGGPLSKDICSNISLNNPVNVLIAGGMWFYNNTAALNAVANMPSEVVLRCDANADNRGCNSEIYCKSGGNILNKKIANDFIGDMEINIP